MTISKSHVQITTLNAVIAFALGVSTLFAIFYNTRATLVEAQTNLSERVAVLETIMPEVRDAIKGIKEGQEEQKSFYYSQILPALEQLRRR